MKAEDLILGFMVMCVVAVSIMPVVLALWAAKLLGIL